MTARRPMTIVDKRKSETARQKRHRDARKEAGLPTNDAVQRALTEGFSNAVHRRQTYSQEIMGLIKEIKSDALSMLVLRHGFDAEKASEAIETIIRKRPNMEGWFQVKREERAKRAAERAAGATIDDHEG